MIRARDNHRFCGREFAPQDVSLIREVVESCPGVSRTELSNTVCELLEWRRPNGGLKGRECLTFFGAIGKRGVFQASGEPWDRTEERYETANCAGKGFSGLGRTVWECRNVFAPGYRTGQERGTASSVQRSCKPLPLPWICHGIWSEASISGVCNPSHTTNCRLCSILQPSLADEGQGSMDWLG